jgi:hypothetical protein
MTSPDPTPADIYAALEVLRADAAEWAGGADTMSTAATNARAAVLPGAAFSFAGQQVGLGASYERLRDRIATLIEQGARNFDDISAALYASATAYEADEAANIHRMRSIY